MSDKTHFDERTPAKVRQVLEKARTMNWIVRIQMGDTETGRVWLEEHDVVGFIGRSTGTQKVPLIVEPLLKCKGHADITTAAVGPALLDHRILRIVNCTTGEELYRHKLYETPKLEINPNVDQEGYNEGYIWAAYHFSNPVKNDQVLVASFKDWDRASEYVAFVQGHKTHMPFRTVDEWKQEMKEQENAE